MARPAFYIAQVRWKIFVKIEIIHSSQSALPRLRRAARQHVLEHFDREKNLAALADLFISRTRRKGTTPMRILYCNKYNFAFSGTEVYLFELMELMRSHGHEAALFSMADPRGEATK